MELRAEGAEYVPNPTSTSERKGKGVLVETDILLDFLRGQEKQSLLRGLLVQQLCYTSIVQISEVLAEADTEEKHQSAMKMLSMLRPLGLSARYSNQVAQNMQRLSDFEPDLRRRIALTASISQFSKVPILSIQYEYLYLRLDIPTIKPNSVRF